MRDSRDFLARQLIAVGIILAIKNGSPLQAEPPRPAVGVQGAVTVGLRKQLLVDDFIVAESSGVMRELGRVTKDNGGKPIFTDGWFYGTVSMSCAGSRAGKTRPTFHR